MNRSRHQIVTLIFSAAVFSAGSVFATSLFKSGEVIWKAGNNVFFKYADQEKSDFGNNDHPVEMAANDISTALGLLKLRNKDLPVTQENLQAAFTATQTKLLGQHLANALEHARPEQDILFALEKSNRRLLGLKSDRLFVAGRAFYKDDKLNIIIGDYDRPRDQSYEAAYDPTNVGIVRYHFDHGSRAKSSRGFKQIVSKTDGIEHKTLENRQRENWLLIDVKAALAADARNTAMRKQQQAAKQREEIKGILGSEAPPTQTALPSLEQRFSTLQGLKDKGLITDEEYAQKRKQLLDEL